MTTPDLAHAHTLAAGPDAAARVFAYVLEGVMSCAPSGLTTASVYDLPNMRIRRVYSDNAEAYPVGNFKTLLKNDHYNTVVTDKRPFVSNTVPEFAAAFFDWEKIEALGFTANLNLPAVADGRVIGTLNLLGRAGDYTPEVVAAVMAWQPALTLAFLTLQLEDIASATFHFGLTAPQNAGILEG